jgi:hypothetical protein
MIRYLLGASAAFLAMFSPAMAVEPNCGDQLAAINSWLSAYPHAPTALDEKYKQAVQLCGDNQDMAAQELVRQIREEMADVSSRSHDAARSSSGSSTPPTDKK